MGLNYVPTSPLSRRPDPLYCRSGRHEWTPENVRFYKDGPRCQKCRNEHRDRRYYTRPSRANPHRTTWRNEDLYQEFMHLGLPIAQAAPRLGLKPKSLERALYRRKAKLRELPDRD